MGVRRVEHIMTVRRRIHPFIDGILGKIEVVKYVQQMLIVTVEIFKTSVALSAATILGRTINQLVLTNVFGHSVIITREGFNPLRELGKRRTVEVDMVVKSHLNHVGGKLLGRLLQSCGVLKRRETVLTTGDVGSMKYSGIEKGVVGMLGINNLIGFGEF